MKHWKNNIAKNYEITFSLGLSFAMAIILNILPLPYQLRWLMPNWLVLVLIYWVIFTPEIIGLSFTFILGIIIDLLLGNLIGINSLCLMPVAFFADRLSIRFRNLLIMQQFLIVLVLISINHLIRIWLQWYIKYPTNNINYWLAIVSSIIFWPLVCGGLNLFRKVVKFC